MGYVSNFASDMFDTFVLPVVVEDGATPLELLGSF